MRQLGEQWIENGRMYKVVLPGLCDGCDFNMGCLQNGGVNCKAGHCVTKQGHVKDLGSVNEEGCLAEERTGLFPEISPIILYYLGKEEIIGYEVYLTLEKEDAIFDVCVKARTEQEAIDAWNRRTM